MGLDMYLSKRTYVKNWDHMAHEELHTVTVTGPQAAHIKSARVSYIEEEVAYWRKANAIHQWFVDVCQDGNDDCRLAHVPRQNLETLRDLCVRLTALYQTDPVAADAEAQQELSPTSGFFFGSRELDEFYWEDVRQTGEWLTALLHESDNGDFYYQSSW